MINFVLYPIGQVDFVDEDVDYADRVAPSARIATREPDLDSRCLLLQLLFLAVGLHLTIGIRLDFLVVLLYRLTIAVG